MIRSRGPIARSLEVATAVLLIGCAVGLAEQPDTGELLAKAEETFDRWTGSFDFVAYEASLRQAIALWEEALTALPGDDVSSRVHVLTRLSQARFELAFAYLTDKRERETTFKQGKDAALAALELDPDFVATRKSDGFRAALRATSDVETIFWYGNTLGQWLSFHRMKALFGGVRDVGVAFERSIEIDETHGGGGPHRSMAAFVAQAHFAIGRSRTDAVEHFERSIAIDPTYLENTVNYAEYYARGTDDDLFHELIATVLAAAEDPEITAVHPLYNHLAIERARALATED